MAFVEITMDTRALDAKLQQLKRPLLSQVVAKALADTQRNAKTKAASAIARHMAVRVARVKQNIITPFVRPDAWTALIMASKRPIPLIDFPTTKQNATGVATRAWGKPQTIRSAFIATMPTGHRGVYWRTNKSRLPIRQLWGPTIVGTFKTPDVAEVIRDTMRERLAINLKRRMNAALRAAR